MTIESQALQQLLDKEAIRELVLCYSRAIDRKDIALLRSLYTEDATDTHGDTYDGSAEGFADYVESTMQYMFYSGHHACNHLISVDGDEASGEVYALAYHIVPGPEGRRDEDFMAVRYLDNYRRCQDGRWRFAKRLVTYDVTRRRPFLGGGLLGQAERDPSYRTLPGDVFKRGRRG